MGISEVGKVVIFGRNNSGFEPVTIRFTATESDSYTKLQRNKESRISVTILHKNQNALS